MMNVQEEILKIKNEMIDEFDKRVEALKEEEQEFPQDGDDYWYIYDDGDVFSTFYNNNHIDRYRQTMGNIFRTKEQAEFVVEKLKVEAELRKFSRPFEEDANNFFIVFNTKVVNLNISYREHNKYQGTIYFESVEKAQQAIEAVGRERIKKYIFGVED